MYIYLITCLIDGKVYVGQENIEGYRWHKHKLASQKSKPKYFFHRSIKKYGIHNFVRKTLIYCKKSQANFIERCFIAVYQSNNRRYGYNLTEGGEGCLSPSKNVRKKMRNAALKRNKNKNYIQQISKCRKKWWASLSKKDRKILCIKISKISKGKKKSFNHCQNISKGAIKRWETTILTKKQHQNLSRVRKACWAKKRKNKKHV